MITVYVWGGDVVVDLFAGTFTGAKCGRCGETTSALGTGKRGQDKCLAKLREECGCINHREYLIETLSEAPAEAQKNCHRRL